MQRFENLLSCKEITVPDYQRAFAWGDRQVREFIVDLERSSQKSITYYYSHFIVECVKNQVDGQQQYDIVDGQ